MTTQEQIAFAQLMANDRAYQWYKKIEICNALGVDPTDSEYVVFVNNKSTITSQGLCKLYEQTNSYHYAINKSTAQLCSIRFFAPGMEIEKEYTLTFEDCRQIKQNGRPITDSHAFQSDPEAQLFAKCLMIGTRRFCPGLIPVANLYLYHEIALEFPNEVAKVAQKPAEQPVDRVAKPAENVNKDNGINVDEKILKLFQLSKYQHLSNFEDDYEPFINSIKKAVKNEDLSSFNRCCSALSSQIQRDLSEKALIEKSKEKAKGAAGGLV